MPVVLERCRKSIRGILARAYRARFYSLFYTSIKDNIVTYNEEPMPANRNTFRIGLGFLMVGFSIYRFLMLLRVLPGLFQNGDTTEILAYGVLPALIVVVFFFGGLRIARQGYYGTDKPKREQQGQ
jgi:hypothetical protein